MAKELLHIRDWLSLADDIVTQGRDAYAGDGLLQEAGDSLMMKLGEAAGRLARAGVEPPPGASWTDAIDNRNWLIHQYDEIDRALTWVTLSRDLSTWRNALADTFRLAELSLSSPRNTDDQPQAGSPPR